MKAFAYAVEQELASARAKYPSPMPTAHDAHGKIREECDEFWDEVKKKEAVLDTPEGRAKMLNELVQIGAMAQRAAEDLGLISDSLNVH